MKTFCHFAFNYMIKKKMTDDRKCRNNKKKEMYILTLFFFNVENQWKFKMKNATNNIPFFIHIQIFYFESL